MKSGYIADIGLEVHAELQTQSKMFCGCPVLDSTRAEPNTAVCPVCAGMPGSLPVVNDQAVAFGLRVALALDCEINEVSQFARKNYFYPDLPKGYQISQYEYPLAEHGLLPVRTDSGWLDIRIRRVHLEEDTGKLTHVHTEDDAYSLVDLNRAGIPLLEIVTEPDMHSIEQVLAYTRSLRMVLQYLGVNSGDLEKGVIRFEANVSVRPEGSGTLGTRVEIKNLNSFRTMTAAIAYELDRQTALLDAGGKVDQETLGWDEVNEATVSQRSKEEAHDYRYFPEPDLPPLVISAEQIEASRDNLPERPDRKFVRFMADLGLDAYQAEILTSDRTNAEFYEGVVNAMQLPDPGLAANWVSGELFGIMNAKGTAIDALPLSPTALAGLLDLLQADKINKATAKTVLEKMAATGQGALAIIEAEGLAQVSDREAIAEVVRQVLAEHPDEVQAYREGKEALRQWFFGQVMRQMLGKANPGVVQDLLKEYL
ncbi:MAG: Asp-tRNA(Asn)/Glu-tRNA(Gln) amidotransferase subunit GatB [Anaerolineaceae bacterium]|nr:Asp-tRNA(Asn)/Glu-tRNA(Gln) amidotransferase subunit GatB [Anaerolineaceae bacterium]